MSANLWDASTTGRKPDADGVYLSGKAGDLHCAIAGTSALAENQTVHMGASLRGADDAGYIAPYVGYMDAAGKKNRTGFPHWTPTGQWQRFEGSCVVPSGMTIYEIGFNTSKSTGNIEVANPVFSYGSPVVYLKAEATVAYVEDGKTGPQGPKGDTGATGPQGPKGATGAAVKSVTRYYQLAASGSSAPSVPASSSKLGSWTSDEPTADTSKVLWQCECTKLDDGTEAWSAATKSSAYEAAKSVSADVTKLSDKVTATVSEQMKWNESYSSRTSSLEQTAAGFSASLDSMSSTDASIHQWMSFAKGTDGKPTLTIGTSDSDIVSRQTNSGLSYQTRGGTELLALDAASRSSTMPHVHADDVGMGNWQLGPTQNGTHFTLMYIGG